MGGGGGGATQRSLAFESRYNTGNGIQHRFSPITPQLARESLVLLRPIPNLTAPDSGDDMETFLQIVLPHGLQVVHATPGPAEEKKNAYSLT